MKEREITSKESLEIISSMIMRTKQRYIGDGNILLMWGYLIIIVSALVWIMITITRQEVWNWLWFLIPLIGGVATPMMARKQELKCGVKTYSDKITSRIWTIFGISEIAAILFCLGFRFFAGINCWSMMLVYTMALMPVAEITQGIIVEEDSLIAGGCVGLLTGISALCCMAGNVTLQASWFMPLFMFSFTVMTIIPGHIINHKARIQA